MGFPDPPMRRPTIVPGTAQHDHAGVVDELGVVDQPTLALYNHGCFETKSVTQKGDRSSCVLIPHRRNDRRRHRYLPSLLPRWYRLAEC